MALPAFISPAVGALAAKTAALGAGAGAAGLAGAGAVGTAGLAGAAGAASAPIISSATKKFLINAGKNLAMQRLKENNQQILSPQQIGRNYLLQQFLKDQEEI
jgi:hypothetical protein